MQAQFEPKKEKNEVPFKMQQRKLFLSCIVPMLGRPLVAPSAELSTGRSNQRSLLFPKFPETMEAVKGIIKTLLTIFFLFR